MASSQVSQEEIVSLLDDFVKQFPNSPDGFLRRASTFVFGGKEVADFDKAAADMERALKVAKKKDDV